MEFRFSKPRPSPRELLGLGGLGQREWSGGFEPMLEFLGNFGRQAGAGAVELESESAVFSDAIKMQFFV